MIVEIALGIVLAVVILWALPLILVVAFYVLVIAVVLAAVGVAIYFAFNAPVASAVIAGIAALIGGAAYWDEKHGYKKPSPLDPTASPTTDSKPIAELTRDDIVAKIAQSDAQVADRADDKLRT